MAGFINFKIYFNSFLGISIDFLFINQYTHNISIVHVNDKGLIIYSARERKMNLYVSKSLRIDY